MQAQIADFEINCPNGRGDCPGKLSELDALRTELGEQCSGCFGASLFPDGVPEEVDIDD